MESESNAPGGEASEGEDVVEAVRSGLFTGSESEGLIERAEEVDVIDMGAVAAANAE